MSDRAAKSLSLALTWASLGILLGLGSAAVWVWHLQGHSPWEPSTAEPPAPELHAAAMTTDHAGHGAPPPRNWEDIASPEALSPSPPAGEGAGGWGAADDILFWTCGMHPSVRSDHPGECPICHMDLIPVRASEQALPAEGEGVGPRLQLNEQARLLGQVATTPVAYHPLDHVIRATGRLVPNETRITHVHSRIGGWIDEVFVDYTGAEVAPGDPLVSIYSEELVTAQQEFLLALRSRERLQASPLARAREGADAIVEAARQRLLRWQISPAQIDELARTGQVQDHLILHYEAPPDTPRGGVVTDRMAIEGVRVERGDRLYTISDLSSLWMLADVYEYEMAWVQVGQEVEITSPAYPGRVFPGEISFIEPSLNPETRSVTVRVEVPNPNMELRPEMFVEARIHIPLDRSNQVLARMAAGAAARFSSSESMNQRVNESTLLAIPDLAVLRTGERELVYVELEPGTYVQREVITGPTGEMTMGGMRETYVPVLAGLRSGERVVTRGNFLIDSQTTLTGSASAAYGSALDTQPSSSSGAEPSPMPGMSH